MNEPLFRRVYAGADDRTWDHDTKPHPDAFWTGKYGWCETLEPLDRAVAEKKGIDSPWYDVGPVFLKGERRHTFLVAVYEIGGEEDE